ncbi:MAG: antibiotic hydrolase [SAR202 cluster bacterium Io17-Chloro-G9]|nr:MAG: antibiotic hydrolase [SAR202 cluster bacterium Io17-Chloro-G9]
MSQRQGMTSTSRSTGGYDAHVQRDVMVPMRDGVLLATDLHRPAQGGQPLDGLFPVLLLRTPYNKSTEARALEARFFVSHGYVAVIQDCRGRYASEGGFSKYVAEGPDGYDTLEWLGLQPWCNGRVGTHGLSYSAHTQAALASLNPPNLGCMWLDSGGFFNAFETGVRNGGAFELRQVTWAFREALESPESHLHPVVTKAALEKQDIHDWFRRLPWKKGHSPLKWTSDYEDYLLDIWGREVFDDYWRQAGLCAEEYHSQFAQIPQVHMGAWYDPYATSTTSNFVAISQAGRGPVNLIMGPWTHGARSVTHSGDIDLGAQSILDNNLDTDYNHLRLRFFDRWLKDSPNGWEAEPPVQLFVMGGGSGRRNSQQRLDHGGSWRVEKEWPLARASNTPFYLAGGGGLSGQLPGGGQSPSRFLFDPDQPVPTIGGNISSGQPIMEAGGFDQRETNRFYGSQPPYLPLAARPDVLVFQTELLEEDMEVTGPISVHLWIASSAPDTDFTAKLLDVYPPSQDYPEGFALNLTDGILRCKFRNSWEKPELLAPDEVYPITIELMPTSNLFVAGHRIRLDVSSSNFPRFDVNGNTGENPGISPVKVIAHNRVFHEAGHPSHVMLPVIPRS